MSDTKKDKIARRLGTIRRAYVAGDDLRVSKASRTLKPPKPPKVTRGPKASSEYHETAIGHIWKLRPGLGAPRIFSNPQDLLNAAEEYFNWVDDNPLKEAKVTHYQGNIVDMELPKMRAMSIRAMCLFLRMSHAAWYDYCKREEFADVTKGIVDAIKNQKFEGAAADLLNPMIIARDLGLMERTDVTSGGESLTQITRKIVDVARDSNT